MLYEPRKPDVSLAKLREDMPDASKLVDFMLLEVLKRGFKTCDFLKFLGLEATLEAGEQLYDMGLVKLIVREEDDGFAFDLGVFDPLTGEYNCPSMDGGAE